MSVPPVPRVHPKIVIHGGAGNITHTSVPPASRAEYLSALSSILCAVHPRLLSGEYTALDAACAAVVLLEDNPLFNAGKGAVFTLDGRNELEASVMVSRGCFKKAAGVFLLETVKNPILLAKELLVRDNSVPEEKGGGTKHNCVSGKQAEQLAWKWGLQIVDKDYFWTKKRWEQHKRGLKKRNSSSAAITRRLEGETGQDVDNSPLPPPYSVRSDDKFIVEGDDIDIELDLDEYLPQGTVGCVALDSTGTLATATSTGGLTNKLPGRIGDTPTIGAGFWAEEWDEKWIPPTPSTFRRFLRFLRRMKNKKRDGDGDDDKIPRTRRRAMAVSGTGNGDMFLRTCACHAIASRCKLAGDSLQVAADVIAGVGGEMDLEGRKSPDPLGGEAGVIGIDENGDVIFSMNSGGMFRGTMDSDGRPLVAAFRDEPLEVGDPCKPKKKKECS